jgi:type II secretory pathway pseudopilin PulG
MRPRSARALNSAPRAPTDIPMARRLVTRLLREEQGFTLVEQLVVCAGLAVILSAILGLSEIATKQGPRDRERVHAVADAQVGLDKMTRELRRAYAITVNPFSVTASMVKNGASVTVTYDCSGAAVDGLRKCVRSQSGVAGTTVAISRVANADARPVFTAQQRADAAGANWTTYVKALVEVPMRGELKYGRNNRVVLEDGFYLRNVDALH